MISEALNLRWDPSILIKNNEFNAFWKDHLADKSKSILFIMGKGFDLRMNLALNRIFASCPDCKLECLVVEYDEGRSSPSTKYKSYVDSNMTELNKLVTGKSTLRFQKIKLWIDDGGKKRRVSSREASNIFQNVTDIEKYSDIIVDVSALPRGIYFSLIGKLLYLLDRSNPLNKTNFFIIAAENAQMDSIIKETGVDYNIDYLTGFGGRIDLETGSPTIWFPILGESKRAYIQAAYGFINPSELCPMLPFPAKNPRRCDSLIKDYHELLFDELRVEPQNIMYVAEQNPFDTYRKLSNVVKHYKKSMEILGDCKTAISTFSSKLLSVGALMAAYEFNYGPSASKGVGVVNVDCTGYDIDNIELFKKLKEESELFVIWLSGFPYAS